MYQKEYEKALEQLKSISEYQQDYSNWQHCIQNIQQYDRINAWSCLQEMIHHYANEIRLFGAIFDHVTLIQNVDINCYSDQALKDQLLYIAAHIPIYVLIRKGERELAHRLAEGCHTKLNISF